jgi:hypothetical protein
VVAQFYATLWIKKVDEEADGYDYPVMYFFIQGNWHKVSYRRFAHILGFSDADIQGSNMRVHNIRLPMREETEFIHVSNDREFWTTANMHRYYRYLNSLSRMTVLPKGGNQMNVLGESRVFLLLLAPNSLARINVFDMIWEEIIRASWSPLKGCLHAPFIMKMIEVVTQTHFEKPVKHSRYVPYWVDSSNPAARTKRAPSGSGGPASSAEPPPQPPHHPSSSRTAAASRPSPGRGSPMPRGRGRGRGRGMGARLVHGIAAFFSMCRNISADVHELARRQRETDDNLRRQASTMGMPFAPRSPDVHLHPPPPEINEWHRQAYGVPFMSADDEEEAYVDDREQFAPPPYHADPGQSSSPSASLLGSGTHSR